MILITKDNIYDEACQGNIEVLDSPLVDLPFDTDGRTPLHELAFECRVEILKHPSVGVVKDNRGRTPLHFIAKELYRRAKQEKNWTLGSEKELTKVLEHPDIDRNPDIERLTPLHELAAGCLLTKEWLEKKYPWFKLGFRPITFDLITDLVNSPKALKFIFDK